MIKLNRLEAGLVESKLSSYLLNRYKEQVVIGYEPNESHMRIVEEIEFIRCSLKKHIKGKTADDIDYYYEEAVIYLDIIDNIEDIVGNGMMDYEELYCQVDETSRLLNVSLLKELEKSTRNVDYIYDASEGKPLNNEQINSINDFVWRHYKDMKVDTSTTKEVFEEIKKSFSKQFMNMQHNNIRIRRDNEEIKNVYSELI